MKDIMHMTSYIIRKDRESGWSFARHEAFHPEVMFLTLSAAEAEITTIMDDERRRFVESMNRWRHAVFCVHPCWAEYRLSCWELEWRRTPRLGTEHVLYARVSIVVEQRELYDKDWTDWHRRPVSNALGYARPAHESAGLAGDIALRIERLAHTLVGTKSDLKAWLKTAHR